MKHIIAVLLENEPGALSRVVGLFSARGYNIESLTVAPTEDSTLSRMTIQTSGSDDVIEQITKHLNRLIEVVKVVDLTEGAYIERELMMVKVRAVGKEREEMKRMADIFRGRIIDVTEKSYTIELTGDQSKNDAFLEAIERGAIAASRGAITFVDRSRSFPLPCSRHGHTFDLQTDGRLSRRSRGTRHQPAGGPSRRERRETKPTPLLRHQSHRSRVT